MSFGDWVRSALDVVNDVGTALANANRAKEEASRLLGMSEPVARRELKTMSQTMDSEIWQLMVAQLDDIAKTDSGRRADIAARLAEYAESL
jgi:hypothetical protein